MIARRRLREVLLGIEGQEREHLADLERRHHRLRLFLGHRVGLLPGLDVDRHEARELERGALGAEQARARIDVGRHRVVDGGEHLAREEALPDQPVQRELILAEIARQLLRLAGDRAGPDRFMRLLRALLGPVHRRRVRQVLAAQPATHPLAGFFLRLGRDAHGVRAHIGDEAHRPLVAEGDPLVELLGQHHRLLRREVELPARFLLQGRRDERRRRVAPPLAPGDRLHDPRPALERRHHGLRVRLGAQLRLLPGHFLQRGHELRRVRALEPSVQRPVLDGDEGLNLPLALGDQPDGDRLHAPRRQPPPHLLPQER